MAELPETERGRGVAGGRRGSERRRRARSVVGKRARQGRGEREASEGEERGVSGGAWQRQGDGETAGRQQEVEAEVAAGARAGDTPLPTGRGG